MRLVFNVLLLGLIGVVAVTVYHIPYSQCNTPLTYNIGSIDIRFETSTSEVITDVGEAAQLLSSAGDKQLFIYSPTAAADLTINFIYDERSALSSKVNLLQGTLNQENTSLQQQVSNYESDVRAFENKIAELNSTIARYNSQGGAPQNVLSDLIDEQSRLRSEGDALNARARQLNLASQDYNSKVQNLNQNEQEFNQALEQKPEEGQYNWATKTITIYFANNKSELIHTLAHELGHAIGMNHVTDENAIMYPYSTKNLEVATEDRQQLEMVCREVPLPQYWLGLALDKLTIFYITNIKNKE